LRHTRFGLLSDLPFRSFDFRPVTRSREYSPFATQDFVRFERWICESKAGRSFRFSSLETLGRGPYSLSTNWCLVRFSAPTPNFPVLYVDRFFDFPPIPAARSPPLSIFPPAFFLLRPRLSVQEVVVGLVPGRCLPDPSLFPCVQIHVRTIYS